jgi:hypothetical protein
MDTCVGLKLVTSTIRDGFNSYKQHIAIPKIKGADNASVQMVPYIIRHFIVQAYSRASKLVGINILMNVPGCVLIKIQQNFSNKVGFYKDCRFNIKGNTQPIVEVLFIESKTAMRCIRKHAVEGQFDSDKYYQLHNSCTTVNANNGWMDRWYGSLFLITLNYLVGSTSPDTILHLTRLQQLPTVEFGYVQHSFKEDFRFPDNLELET